MKLFQKLSNHEIDTKKIKLTSNEIINYTIYPTSVYSLNKAVRVTSSAFVNCTYRLFNILTLGGSTTIKDYIFANSIREYGVGLVYLTNKNIIIITNNGHYNIRYINIIYCNYISNEEVMIIEKNKKTIIIKSDCKNCNLIVSSFNTSSKSRTLELCFNELGKVIHDKDFKQYVFLAVQYKGEVIINQKCSFKQMIEKILRYFISLGIYFEVDNLLLSTTNFKTKTNEITRQQIHVGMYYINTSSKIDNKSRYHALITLLTNANIQAQTLLVKYYKR